MSSVRTPDPNPGWLSEEDLREARARLPIVRVQFEDFKDVRRFLVIVLHVVTFFSST